MQGLLEDDLWKSLWSHCYALPPYSEGGKVDVLATTKGKSIVDSYLCYLAWHLSPLCTGPFKQTLAVRRHHNVSFLCHQSRLAFILIYIVVDHYQHVHTDTVGQ